MAKLTVESDRLIVELQGWHRFLALREKIEIPIRHLTAVRPDPGLTLGWFDRLKLIGGYFPGQLAVGTFLEDGELVFFDVNDPANAIVIELRDEPWRRLVLEVGDPDAMTRRLRPLITPT
jgi:hypothetical protein